MIAQTNLYIQPASAATLRRRQLRRRRELFRTIFEGLSTLGIGAGFILCAILFLCVI